MEIYRYIEDSTQEYDIHSSSHILSLDPYSTQNVNTHQGPRLQDIALRSTGGTASNETFTLATGRVLKLRIRSVMALQLMTLLLT